MGKRVFISANILNNSLMRISTSSITTSLDASNPSIWAMQRGSSTALVVERYWSVRKSSAMIGVLSAGRR